MARTSAARLAGFRPAALALAGLAACGGDAPAPHAVRLAGAAMGTAYAVAVPRAGEGARARIAAAVQAELEGVDRRMSTYRADSELSRFNRHRSTAAFALSEETFAVLAAARAVSEATGGAFDVTVGPLVDAWGFGPGGAADPPADAEVERLLAVSGWQRLELDETTRGARKTVPDLRCDLSAIAKGYAVDRVADALAGLGYRDYLVEVGGEVRASGSGPRGGRWRLGIERPEKAASGVQRIVEIGDTGVATSGDYRNFRLVGGEPLGHVLDPRTGRPAATAVASATVLHASAMRADAFATALLVLGEAEGLELAEREGLAALLLVRDRAGGVREAPSSRFRARVKLAGR